jgi:hypothetical protein
VSELVATSSAAELGRLLFVALRTSGLSGEFLHILHVLINAPGAKGLEQELVWDLLRDAVRNTGYEAVQLLAKHPAVQSMPARLLGDLLGEAFMRSGFKKVISDLCRLPAVQEIGLAALEELLRVAVQGGHEDIISDLCRLPVAQQVEVVALEELIRSAVKGGQRCTTAIITLCKLPSAKQVGVAALRECLRGAVEGKQLYTTIALCALPAAQQVEVAVVEELFRRAVKDGNRSWYSHHRYQTQVVHPAVAHLYKAGTLDSTILSTLFDLPAAKQVGVATVEELLRVAVKGGQLEATSALCDMPAAQQIDVAVVEELVKVAGAKDCAPRHARCLQQRQRPREWCHLPLPPGTSRMVGKLYGLLRQVAGVKVQYRGYYKKAMAVTKLPPG